jgi:hypothetical protein
MNDHEFIEFMKELILAPDSAIKKAHMERAVSIISTLNARVKELEDGLAEWIKNECEGTTGE